MNIPQPADTGCQVRDGIRQSIPSSSIENCAGVNVTDPSRVIGHTNRPLSSRFANRQKPWPSQNKTFTRSPRRPPGK